MRIHPFFSIVYIVLVLISGCHKVGGGKEMSYFSVASADAALQNATRQYQHLMQALPDSTFPRTFEDGKLVTSNAEWWCSGFYPGTLWYLYEYTNEPKLKEEAIRSTALIEPIQHLNNTHDLGFMLFCSFGNGYRITQDAHYKEVLITGAQTLASRYSPKVKAIRSWDWTGPREVKWQYPVIIDNMMNLELLMWTSDQQPDQQLAEIAVSHANTTLVHHFRDDFSTFHVIDYDSVSGKVLHKHTNQGYADASAWARGQAWALYGYTMMYRETHNDAFLQQARKVADFLLTHPNMPEDMIPYWDFDTPDIPNAPRDASAAAVMASALLELSQQIEEADSGRYYLAATKMLASLSSEKYQGSVEKNGGFILQHSVGAYPKGSEVDVPLSYADYYYVEALLRFMQIEGAFQFKSAVQ
ncbi:glycoside hydrolase family 88 protein [Limibacter armeniacum]|uniref:glycoside hydrolase family 88 protein n=1 Tax=Limibacter armeniacum TaxID=466084 RepID=UPI002FE5B039